MAHGPRCIVANVVKVQNSDFAMALHCTVIQSSFTLLWYLIKCNCVSFVFCFFVSQKQASMESDKSSERQYLLEQLLETVKQVKEYYWIICKWLGFWLISIENSNYNNLWRYSLWTVFERADNKVEWTQSTGVILFMTLNCFIKLYYITYQHKQPFNVVLHFLIQNFGNVHNYMCTMRLQELLCSFGQMSLLMPPPMMCWTWWELNPDHSARVYFFLSSEWWLLVRTWVAPNTANLALHPITGAAIWWI